MSTEPMLSVAQVFEMEPGTEQEPTWVNPGFVGYVEKIVQTKTKKTGTAMNICTLRDVNGSAEISMTVFGPVKFSEGDTIEARDGGIRRTEYNRLAQVSLGKGTTIHLVSQGRPSAPPAARPASFSADKGQTTTPVTNGPRINGQTVGMAMKEALLLVGGPEVGDTMNVNTPEFWAQVHTTASDIIRVSAMLESGRLAPSPKSRQGAGAAPEAKEAPVSSGGRADPPKGARPLPGLDGAVALDTDSDDPPF
jgi:hypothetical protein